MTITDQIAALRKREAICWDMLGVFLDSRDAHGCHDLGVEIQGIQWALRELEKALETAARLNDEACAKERLAYEKVKMLANSGNEIELFQAQLEHGDAVMEAVQTAAAWQAVREELK